MKKITSEYLAVPEVKNPNDIFNIQPMDGLMKEKLIPPKKLVGDLVYLNELTILFGKSGNGKSILANQIADSISRGVSLDLGSGIILDNESEPFGVILYDFELSKSQVQKRFGKGKTFGDFYRAEIKDGEFLDGNPKEVVEKLKYGADSVNARCIIIDNISAISGDVEKADNAVKFMQQLNAIKKKGYTIIVIAHTPKMNDYITLVKEQIAGSNKLNVLTDAVIGIGKANVDNANEYYIKHCKGRNDKETYNSFNVIHTIITERNGNVCHIAQGNRNELDLITNLNAPENAPNRILFTLAHLYYGSSRKASKVLEDVGIKAPHSTIANNSKAYKEIDGEQYKEWKKLSDDSLKDWLDTQTSLDDILPEKANHKAS